MLPENLIKFCHLGSRCRRAFALCQIYIMKIKKNIKKKISIDQPAIGTTGSTSTIIVFEGLGFSAHALSKGLHMVA